MSTLALWGYTIDEYRAWFDLTDDAINSAILEYGCGLSAVNAQQTKQKHKIVSCDPLFVLDKNELQSKAQLIFAQRAQEIKKEQEHFDFSRCGGYDSFVAERQKGMDAFFADYEAGVAEQRYLGLNDYHLPFADFTFDLALSAYYLSTNPEHQTLDDPLNLLRELARVAKEVRIIPLMDKTGTTLEWLGPVLLGLQQENYGVEVREVDMPLHQKGNAMLRVWAQQCIL